MPAYRIYQIDGSGRFSTADWIQADDDEAALAAARKGSRSATCEVWQARRLVGRIENGGSGEER